MRRGVDIDACAHGVADQAVDIVNSIITVAQ